MRFYLTEVVEKNPITENLIKSFKCLFCPCQGYDFTLNKKSLV